MKYIYASILSFARMYLKSITILLAPLKIQLKKLNVLHLWQQRQTYNNRHNMINAQK